MDIANRLLEPSGSRVLQAERLWVGRLLSNTRRNDLLQIGGSQDDSFVQDSRVTRAFFLDRGPATASLEPYIQAKFDALPVQSGSMDIVLCVHALECQEDIDPVLQDIYRVLKPEGRVLITGFQRFGLWRLWNCFLQKKLFPEGLHFYSVDYLAHALESIGFTVEVQQTACFRLPSQKKRWLFLETLGQLLLPYHGAVYMMMATKKEPGMTPLFEPLFVKKTSTQAQQI